MVNLHKKRRVRWCALLCAVCMVLLAFSFAPKAQAAGTGSVYGSTVYAEPGGTVSVTFSVSGNPGIWGLKGSISYDSSAMKLSSVSAGSIFSASEMSMGDVNQNPFSFLANSNAISDVTKNGSLIKLTFTVNSDAAVGDYSVKVGISQAINANGEDVGISTSSATVKVVSCLHTSTYLLNAVEPTETTEGYSGDSYCAKCNVLVSTGYVLPIVVNTCPHENTEWQDTILPTCETEGKKELICLDCNKSLEEEVIEMTGHEKTVIVDQKAATTTEEGYTGDIRCEACDTLVESGAVIPKIMIYVFNMTTQSADSYIRGSQASLVFSSNAHPGTFVRVEVNGAVLDEHDYTLESNHTQVTLKPEYLETLSDGKYTITIVSDAGTASAQFQVGAEETPTQQLPVEVLLIITGLSVVVAITSVVFALIVTGKKSKKQGG